MTNITINDAFTIIFFLILLFVIAHGRAEYWKCRAEILDENKNDYDGWRSEALYHRSVNNPQAAEFAENN